MVKEEEIITEAGGRGYMDMLGSDDYLLCLSPSSYFSPPGVSTSTSVIPVATTCASYLPPPYHHILSFNGQEHHGDLFGFHYGGDHFSPVVIPQKSSPTTDQCSSSVSSMSSSPTATISSSKPQAKKKGRGGDQKRTAAAAASAAAKRPRVSASTTTTTTIGTTKVRRERLGERILALQQLVSPFGKSDTASVLHEALGYIRFLHDQVQVLSSPYMKRLPLSAHLPVLLRQQQERPAGVVVEPQQPGELRSRGLCLVPVSCTEHVAGNGNGADLWSAAAGAEENNNASANANAE